MTDLARKGASKKGPDKSEPLVFRWMHLKPLLKWQFLSNTFLGTF